MTRIFIFEEQQLFNEALQFFINSQPNYSVVGSHNDEGSLLECLYGVNADIILFGINMMSSNSHFMIEQIKNEFKNLKIIVLNDGLDIKEIRRLYKIGVNGFLEKKSHNGELLNSIDSVMSGKIYLDVKIRERFFSEYFDNLFKVLIPSLSKALRAGLEIFERKPSLGFLSASQIGQTGQSLLL